MWSSGPGWQGLGGPRAVIRTVSVGQSVVYFLARPWCRSLKAAMVPAVSHTGRARR